MHRDRRRSRRRRAASGCASKSAADAAIGAGRAHGRAIGQGVVHPGASIDVLLIAAALLQLGDEGHRIVRSSARRTSRPRRRARARHPWPCAWRRRRHRRARRRRATPRGRGRPRACGPARRFSASPSRDQASVSRVSTRAAFIAVKLVLVEEVAVAALVAEEQPVAAGRLRRHALVQEGAERRHAGAGPDHDDRHGGIGGQAEMLRLLDIDLDACRREPTRSARKVEATPRRMRPLTVIAHGVDRERDARCRRPWARTRSSRAAAAADRAPR